MEFGFEARWFGCGVPVHSAVLPSGNRPGHYGSLYPIQITGSAPFWGPPRVASSSLSSSATAPRGQGEALDLHGRAASGQGGGSGGRRSQFLILQCLWRHVEVSQGLKARERETKEGIKSRNVP